MGERLTCMLMGLIAGAVGGFFAHAGLSDAQPVWKIILVCVLLGALAGSVAALAVGLTRVERLLGSLALFGLILGAWAGLLCSVGVILLDGLVPWHVVSAALGLLAGYIICWLCGRRSILPTTAAASD